MDTACTIFAFENRSHLGEFETEFKKALARESGAQGVLFDEKIPFKFVKFYKFCTLYDILLENEQDPELHHFLTEPKPQQDVKFSQNLSDASSILSIWQALNFSPYR
jgi:hypothetical protein